MSNLKILAAVLLCPIGSPVLAQDANQLTANQDRATLELASIKVVTVELQSDVPLPSLAGERLRRYITSRNIDDSPDWVEELEDRARDLFQHYGYFRASVRSSVRRLSGNELERNFALTFHVAAGRQYRLDELSISGSKVFSPEVLRSCFPLQEGDVFDTYRLRAGMEALREIYGNEGYINFVAVPSFQIDENHSRISLRLEIEAGSQFRVRQVTILGLEKGVAEKLLQDSGLKSGVVFSAKSVADFMRDNPSIFPRDVTADDNVERRINDDRNTVDLVFRATRNEP